jgi:chromate transporter
MVQKPSFKDAFKFWLKLGFISFGGPAGQIAIMHEFLVDKKKWISDKKFLHALNYCMLLPGPEAQQLATYVGWLLHGVKGGLTAGLLFILPSVFILLGLSVVYVEYGKIPWVYALFNGLKPAVIAIVILALIKIGKKSLHKNIHYLLALLSFVAIFFFHVLFPVIILFTILIAIVLKYTSPRLFQSSNKTVDKNDNEEGYYLTTNSVIPHTGFNLARLLKQIGVFILLWSTPLILFYIFTPSDFPFWKQLSLFFTQAAFITFGGAYAVLPYVAQKAVDSFHWLTNLQMIDGLALGESTPGPLIMILVFVGFMAGYSNSGNLLVPASVGLLATTFYTFLPSFLFIFAGAPIIEKTQNNHIVKDILNLVTAAIVGVVLNLTIFFGQAVIFGEEDFHLIRLNHINYINLGWIIISFIAMYRFKISMIPWIGISALFGLVVYLLH